MENFSQGYGLGTKSGSKIDESSSGDDLVSTNTGSAYSLREDRLVLCMAAALAVAAIPQHESAMAGCVQSVPARNTLPRYLAGDYSYSSEECGVSRGEALLDSVFHWICGMGGVAGNRVIIFCSRARRRNSSGFANKCTYLVTNGCLATALEIQPYRSTSRPIHRLRSFDRVGATALLFGLLSYFLLIPGFSVDSGSAIWSSSLALFVALDCYIILRLWHLRDSADSKEYRFRYTWALLGVIIWGLGDLFWLLMYENILNDSSTSTWREYWITTSLPKASKRQRSW